MSVETRQAVFNSFRFKASEHLSSELIYGGLVAYVLSTRTVLDIEENAIPAFLVLVACYQMAGLIVKAWQRQVPDRWDLVYWFFGTTIFSAGYILAMYGGVAIAVDVWAQLNVFLAQLDPLANQTQFMVVTGLTVSVVGYLLFWFRLKQRFLYGLTEAGVGVFVGMHRVTMEQWSGVPTSANFYLALLTAGIYLIVRGLDNIYQAYRDDDPTLQRFALFFLRKPLRRDEVRRRVPRIRPIRMRKMRIAK